MVSFLYLGITLFPAGCSVIGLIAKYQFPIRDARTVGLIQDGTMALANGSAALDPVTGRSIRRPKLNPKEEQAYWLLENFGQKAWRRITTDSGKARGLAFLSLIWAAGSTSVAAALGGAALYTVLSFMEDPQNSINATMAIIAAMFSLCWSFVCISSFMDARKLQRLEPRFLYDLILQLQKCRDVNGTIIPSSAAR